MVREERSFRNNMLTDSEICKTYIGLLSMAKTDFTNVELFRNDKYFRLMLGLDGVPSEENLIDVSPFDNSGTKKEGVSRTYQGNDGYAPIFAYLGKNEG
jgi:hypothetical protein